MARSGPRALPLGYADFAAWERQWLAEGEAERQLAWWREQLGDEAPALQLPTDRPRTAQRSHAAARHSLRLDDELAKALRALAQAEHSTLFMVLLAAFQGLLFRLSGQADIRVGVPGANRQRLETQGLVGFFINTLVLRGQLDGRRTFSALLAQARKATLGAQANQDLPFDRLVDAQAASRSRSCSTTSSATSPRCAACRACSPMSCPGTAARPSSTCNCTARKTPVAA